MGLCSLHGLCWHNQTVHSVQLINASNASKELRCPILLLLALLESYLTWFIFIIFVPLYFWFNITELKTNLNLVIVIFKVMNSKKILQTLDLKCHFNSKKHDSFFLLTMSVINSQRKLKNTSTFC